MRKSQTLSMPHSLISVLNLMLCLGPEKLVKPELADVRVYCAEGVAEAEACGDVEMQAEFLMQGVILDILEGHPVDNTRTLLKVNILYK